MLLVNVLFASWRYQWQQILLVVFGLLCASAGLSSVLALNETAKQKMSQLSTPFVGKPQSIATLASDRVFSKQDYANLLNQGWQVVGLFRFGIESGDQTLSVVALDTASLLTQIQRARIRAINAELDSDHESSLSNSTSLTPTMDMSLWQRPMVSPKRYNWFQSHINKELWPLPSPIPIPAIKDDNLYISMSAAGSLDEKLNINELWIFNPISKQQANLLAHAGFDLTLISSDTGTLTDSFYINITAMGLLMFAVSMFISLNAYNLLFSGRKLLVRQLYLTGISTEKLKTLFAIECNLLTVLCCSLGFVLGLFLAEVISPGMEMTLRNLYGASFEHQKVSFFHVWVTVLLSGLLAANIILVFPLRNALRKHNKIDARREVWLKLSQPLGMLRRHSLFIATTILCILALWLHVFPDSSLLLSFLFITICVLSGCCIVLLLIPKVLFYVKSRVSPDAPLLYYFCADAVRLSDKSRIAVCAFFIAITANIGMNLMVGSFRLATVTWINQQFVADYYLSTNEAEQFQHWAQQQNNLDIFHRARAEIKYEGRKTEILPMPANLNGHLPLLFKSTAPPSPSIKNGSQNEQPDHNNLHSVLINEQMSIRHQLRVLDEIQLGTENYRIAGIYYDYGNMKNQILVDEAIHNKFYINNGNRQLFSIIVKSPQPGLINSLETQLDSLNVSYFSGEQIKKISLKVFEQTFVITSGLNLITLLVAGASLATSILIIEGQNDGQTRILRHMGISGRKIWSCSLLQYGYLISVVFLLSVPFGILLSYQLINNINYTAFQWSYPLQHDIVSYGFVYCIALLTVLFAVSFPYVARRLINIKTIRQNRDPNS